MVTSRFRTIHEVAEDIEWMRGPLVSALVNCLDAHELAEGLDKVPESQWVLRRALIRTITRDPQRLAAVQDHVLGSLLAKFHEADYRTVRAFAYVLREVSTLDILPDQRRRLIAALLGSKYAHVRASGYKAIRQTPDDPLLNSNLEIAFRTFEDPQCAALIIDRLPVELILENFEALNSSVVTLLGKARLYMRVADNDPTLLTRLRNYDEVTWLYSKVKLGHPPLSSEDALALFWRNELHPELALLLWCFGQWGLWGVLTEIASRRDYFQGREYLQKLINARR